MANSITNEVAIYRCSNPGDTEANLPDLESVGMDYGARDTSSIAVVSFTWETPDRQTDVPTPSSKALSKPDTGVANITLTIGMKFNEKVSDNTKIGTLTKWGIDAKSVRGKFSAARFGIRNDKKIWCNFQPTLTAGWKIVDVNMDDILQYGGLLDCVVTLQFAGVTQELINQIIANGG